LLQLLQLPPVRVTTRVTLGRASCQRPRILTAVREQLEPRIAERDAQDIPHVV
jgi:hypothetical protein